MFCRVCVCGNGGVIRFRPFFCGFVFLSEFLDDACEVFEISLGWNFYIQVFGIFEANNAGKFGYVSRGDLTA